MTTDRRRLFGVIARSYLIFNVLATGTVDIHTRLSAWRITLPIK
jgi:hypothetical protein